MPSEVHLKYYVDVITDSNVESMLYYEEPLCYEDTKCELSSYTQIDIRRKICITINSLEIRHNCTLLMKLLQADALKFDSDKLILNLSYYKKHAFKAADIDYLITLIKLLIELKGITVYLDFSTGFEFSSQGILAAFYKLANALLVYKANVKFLLSCYKDEEYMKYVSNYYEVVQDAFFESRLFGII